MSARAPKWTVAFLLTSGRVELLEGGDDLRSAILCETPEAALEMGAMWFDGMAQALAYWPVIARPSQ